MAPALVNAYQAFLQTLSGLGDSFGPVKPDSDAARLNEAARDRQEDN